MNPIPFSFGNAISHYTKTGGPGGFLWKFALAYALFTCVTQAMSVWLQWPIYEIYLRMITDSGDMESHMEDLNNISAMASLRGLLVMPLGILLWMVFEGANQRRYMRGDGFRLRIGADEGRLFVVGLIWMAFFIAIYIGFAISIIIPIFMGLTLGADGAWISVLLGFAIIAGYFLLVLWIAARLSAAAALTVRDRQIRFFESWRITKGKGWTILGSWVVLMLIMLFVYVVLYVAAAALGWSLINAQVPDFNDGSHDQSEIVAAVISPAFFGPMLGLLFVFMLVQAAFMHVFSGPAALAARTDPAWSGMDLAGEFS
ncbi:MAG: hypothetical protein R3C08_09235 [Hyphomonas sp.]